MPSIISNIVEKKETTKSSPYQSSSDYGPELPSALPNRSTFSSGSKTGSNTNTPMGRNVPARTNNKSGTATSKLPAKTSNNGCTDGTPTRKMSTCSTSSTVSIDDSFKTTGSYGNLSPTNAVKEIKFDASKNEEEGTTSTTSPLSVSSFYLKDHYGLETPNKKSDGKTTSEDTKLKLELEKCYARCLCYGIGSGGVYTSAQVDFVTGLLRAKGYEMVESVDAMFTAASHMVELELVSEVGSIVEAGQLKSVAPVMLYDMYRAAAVAGYPGMYETI